MSVVGNDFDVPHAIQRPKSCKRFRDFHTASKTEPGCLEYNWLESFRKPVSSPAGPGLLAKSGKNPQPTDRFARIIFRQFIRRQIQTPAISLCSLSRISAQMVPRTSFVPNVAQTCRKKC